MYERPLAKHFLGYIIGAKRFSLFSLEFKFFLREDVSSLPGVSRWGVDSVLEYLR